MRKVSVYSPLCAAKTCWLQVVCHFEAAVFALPGQAARSQLLACAFFHASLEAFKIWEICS